MQLSLRALNAVENRQGETWVPFGFGTGAPPELRAGDRLWLMVESAPGAWLYAVGAYRHSTYQGLWSSPPSSGPRLAFPGGLVLDDQTAHMDTLFVVSSAAELPSLEGFNRADCSHLVAHPAPTQPADLCELLYSLTWKVPPRPRGLGLYPRSMEIQDFQGTILPAAMSSNSGKDLIAVEFQFFPR